MVDNAPRKRTQNFTQPDGVALKEHLEKMIAGQGEYFLAALLAAEKTTELSARRQDEQMERMAGDIRDLKRSRDQAAGAASQNSVIIALLFGAAGLVIGIINLLA